MTAPIIHELKTWPEYFSAIARGDKAFELRKNDRGFKMHEELLLREYNPVSGEYTGRMLHRQITYILTSEDVGFGIMEGFCVMGIRQI